MYHERCSRVQTKSKPGWEFLDGWLSQPCPCAFCFATCTSLQPAVPMCVLFCNLHFASSFGHPRRQLQYLWHGSRLSKSDPIEGFSQNVDLHPMKAPKLFFYSGRVIWLRLVRNPCRSDSWCSCIGTCMLCSNWSSWHSACGQMKINLRIACLGLRLGEFTEAISEKFPVNKVLPHFAPREWTCNLVDFPSNFWMNCHTLEDIYIYVYIIVLWFYRKFIRALGWFRSGWSFCKSRLVWARHGVSCFRLPSPSRFLHLLNHSHLWKSPVGQPPQAARLDTTCVVRFNIWFFKVFWCSQPRTHGSERDDTDWKVFGCSVVCWTRLNCKECSCGET